MNVDSRLCSIKTKRIHRDKMVGVNDRYCLQTNKYQICKSLPVFVDFA
jgi:hypothetical protein